MASMEELKAAVQPAANKYAAKLTHSKRCKMAAAHLAGHRIPVIASAFDVHYRTARDICSEDSTKYRRVKAEITGIGTEAFIEKYLTLEDVELLNGVGLDHKTKADTFNGPVATGGPSKRANRAEGTHIIDGRTIAVSWREQAWYWGEYDEWFGPFNTSHEALIASKESF